VTSHFFSDHTVLHVIAATLSLLLLAGMFSSSAGPEGNPVEPTDEEVETGHCDHHIDSEA
jgi:hypothetical protein